jgi:hypothetical protein
LALAVKPIHSVVLRGQESLGQTLFFELIEDSPGTGSVIILPCNISVKAFFKKPDFPRATTGYPLIQRRLRPGKEQDAS